MIELHRLPSTHTKQTGTEKARTSNPSLSKSFTLTLSRENNVEGPLRHGPTWLESEGLNIMRQNTESNVISNGNMFKFRF